LRSRNTENRIIVERVIFDWAVVDYFMTISLQMFNDYAFKFQARMVTSDVNSHFAIMAEKPNGPRYF
jgi:hypothetical protein